jgi:hypothetical protein
MGKLATQNKYLDDIGKGFIHHLSSPSLSYQDTASQFMRDPDSDSCEITLERHE